MGAIPMGQFADLLDRVFYGSPAPPWSRNSSASRT